MSALALAQPEDRTIAQVAHLAVLSLGSPSSRRNYTAAIKRFLTSGHALNREGIQAYMVQLRESGAGAVTRNVHLAAVRLLAREAHARGLLNDTQISAIDRVRTTRVSGARMGNWLSIAEVKRMIEHAGEGKNGARNQALLALMLGCGLRRAEVCGLDWDQLQARDGRAVLVDVRGKGDTVRVCLWPGG